MLLLIYYSRRLRIGPISFPHVRYENTKPPVNSVSICGCQSQLYNGRCCPTAVAVANTHCYKLLWDFEIVNVNTIILCLNMERSKPWSI